MYDDSIRAFKQAIRIEPYYEGAWYQLGSIYQEQEEYNNAINAFTKVTKLNRKDKKIWRDLGNLYLEIEEYQKTVECYETFIILNIIHV